MLESQLWCTREPHVMCSQASSCTVGDGFLWGKVCLCFLDLPEQAQPVQSDSSPLGPAWTMWPSAPRGASQQRVQLCLWATVTDPALWLHPILTFWQSPHFLFQVLWHLKKLPSFFNISILTSILIKNWMKPAWAHPLGLPVGPGSIKGCSKVSRLGSKGGSASNAGMTRGATSSHLISGLCSAVRGVVLWCAGSDTK